MAELDETHAPAEAARRGLGKAMLMTTLAALLLAGAYFYFGVLRPTPRAHRHVPRGTTMAVRLDAVRILAFKPVRERLLPLLGDASGDSEASASMRRLHELSGVRLPSDLREAVIGSVDASHWFAALGGTLEPGRFVDGLDVVLKERGQGSWVREGELLVHPVFGAIGQAEDGTIVAGTSKSIALAALTERDEDPSANELPLGSNAAITFMMNSAAYRGALRYLPSFLSPVDALESIDRIRGSVNLTDAPTLEVRLKPRGTAAPALAEKLDGQLGMLKLAMLVTQTDAWGARRALQSATVATSGDEVAVNAKWPYDALDEGLANLAETLRVVLAGVAAVK